MRLNSFFLNILLLYIFMRISKRERKTLVVVLQEWTIVNLFDQFLYLRRIVLYCDRSRSTWENVQELIASGTSLLSVSNK